VLYAGRTLTLVPVEAGYMLRSGDLDVAQLAQPPGIAATADGRWWVENPRGSLVDARWERGGERVATYRPGVAGGGVIRVAEGSSYALRPPGLGSATRLRRRLSRRTLARFAMRSGQWEASLDEASAGEPHFALALVVALHAVLLEQLMPHGAGGGGPIG
jgi:hypothetical protein